MRILQLSTHTTLLPRHGGKLRSHHLARVLEQLGFDLRRIAFCFRAQDDLNDSREPIIDVGFMRYRNEFAPHQPIFRYLSDYIPTAVALTDPPTLKEFDRLFRAAAPDIVLLEHPWTWPLLERLEEVRSGSVRIVYSSQNVETPLKRRILAEERIEPPPGILEGVEALERGLVSHAAAVITCTQADADIFSAWGARRVVVAPNGGVRRERDHLLDVLPWPLEPTQSYAFAVGSGHPPNVSGFLELVAPSLPLLRPHQRIVIAGGAAPSIVDALAQKGLTRMAEGRLISLGPVDEFCLDCAIANANVLLLPIRYGGGSNVKTAEALLSGRPIVASTMAMRGFDAFRDEAGVAVAEDAVDFGAAMLKALDRPFQPRAAENPALSSLLWEGTIAPLVALMREWEAELDAGSLPARSSPRPMESAGQAA